MSEVLHESYPQYMPPTGEDTPETPQDTPAFGWSFSVAHQTTYVITPPEETGDYEPRAGDISESLVKYQNTAEIDVGVTDPTLIEPYPGATLGDFPTIELASHSFPMPSLRSSRHSVEGSPHLESKFQSHPSNGELRPTDLSSYLDRAQGPEMISSLPDWSFIQRRYELPLHARTDDCPSMTTGSTISSRNSSTRSTKSFRLDGAEVQEKGVCPYTECGRIFRDLKAHVLTHQAERPEKCPVETCEYHVKGFARPHDKVRHTMSHFKGTMVCGFCPGSGTGAEKSFNRCDVFTRHLINLHGVQQNVSRRNEPHRAGAIKAPRKPSKSQGVATCSLCSEPFDAQGFYEHLSGCVLRQVARMYTKLQPEVGGEQHTNKNPVQSKESPRNDSLICLQDKVQGLARPIPEELHPSDPDHLHSRLRSFAAPINIEPQERNPESKEIAELTASSRCLSLTSSAGEEAVKSSDEETDWTEDAGSPASEPDANGLRPMLSPMKRQLVDAIMKEFHRIFDKSLRTRNGGGSSGAADGYGVYGSSSSGSSTYSNSSFISRKRSLSGGGSPPNDSGDDPNKRRRPDPKPNIGKQPMPELRFACPYYKRNPGRHQTFTSCRDPGFITVARLKEHLYRRHLLPIQCNRCCSTFPNEPTLREHQRDPRGCEIREQIPLEGFDKDQERRLKSKKRSLVYQSEEDKWKGVYRILFPDDDEADMPSPYIQYQPCNVGQGEPSNVARFQEFSRLELPRLVRRTLEVAVEEEAQPLEEKLRERLVDIVRECQTQLISLFQQSSGPTNVEAPELVPTLPDAARNLSEQDTRSQPVHAPFRGFESFTAATDFIPIPAIQYQACEQPKPEASGSPDSGYDSTWTSSGFPQETNFPHDPTFVQDTGFGQTPSFIQQAPLVDNGYVELGGYYGLFEDRSLDYAGAAHPSWAYLDPTNANGNGNGAGPSGSGI